MQNFFSEYNFNSEASYTSKVDQAGFERQTVKGETKHCAFRSFRTESYMPVSPLNAVMFEAASTSSEPIDFTGDVVLTKNYAPTEPIVVEGEVKLDMGGKTITGPAFPTAYDAEGNVTETDSYGLWVKNGGEVVIDGTGVIEAQPATYSMAVWANGGKVVINDGTFKNGEGSDLIYASAGGQVEIYGGEFFPSFIPAGTDGTAQSYCALNLKNDGKDGSKIVVYGGRFHNFNPADNKSESAAWRAANPNQFVAEGYISVEVEPNVWEVKKAE